MKHKAIGKRFFTALFAILSCITIFGGAVLSQFHGFVDREQNVYAATSDEGDAYELLSFTVAQADGWIFTESTSEDMLYKMVTITVKYNNVTSSAETEYALSLSATDAPNVYAAAQTGEQVTFSSISKSASSVSFTVELTPREDATAGEAETSKSVSFACNPSSRVQNGIFADFNKDEGDKAAVNSGTNIISVARLWPAINVYPTYNDGSRGDADPMKTSNYTLSGDFFPAHFSEDYYDGYTYDKEITVSTDSSSGSGPIYTTTVVWQGVKFASPNRVGNDGEISGRMPNQYARSGLQIDGLTVTLRYDSSITVPLSVFEGYFDPIYYTSYNDSDTVDELTRRVTRVKISFYYPGKEGNDWLFNTTFDGVIVNALSIHVPQFPDVSAGLDHYELTYNEGAQLEIGNWDYNALYSTEDEFKAPEISITAVNADTRESADISVTGISDTDPEDGIVTVDFNKTGMTYLVTVALPTEGDFQWDNPPYGHVKKPGDDNFKLQFTVQVDKGTFDEVELLDIEELLTYGEQNGNGTLEAKIGDVTLSKPWTLEDESRKGDHLSDRNAWFYHLEYYTRYESETDNDRVPANELRGDRPQYAGTYYVVAVTHENGGYLSKTSAAVSFTIQPFEVETSVENKVFARTVWGLEDFLSQNDFPYSDTADDVLSITSGVTEFRYAGNYSVTVELKDSRNYAFKDISATSTTLSFAITTYTESSFEFSVSSWVYGETADPNLTITSRSTPYYPSNHNSLDDFEIQYFKYDGGVRGDEVTSTDYKLWEVGSYVAVVTAKREETPGDGWDADLEYALPSSAVTVRSYTLPVKEVPFSVLASPIRAPYLDDPWVLSGNSEKELYRYDDKGTGLGFDLQAWIGDGNNTAADGFSSIITIKIEYTLWVSTDKDAIAVTDFSNGHFTVNKAGKYTVTVTLNPNYSWEKGDFPYDLDPNSDEYQFVGYVSRQELDVLSAVTGTENRYNGSEQTKKIENWNANALIIENVTGTNSLNSGIAADSIDFSDSASGYFTVRNAGTYKILVSIADKDNYVWQDPTDGETRQLTLTYELERAFLQVQWTSEEDLADSLKPGTESASGDHFTFIFNGTNDAEQETPVAVAVGNFDDDKNLQIESYKYFAYNEGNAFTSEITRALVNAKGYYYIAVADWTGEAAANYQLPDPLNANVGTLFEIGALALNAPTKQDGAPIKDATIEVEYACEVYDIREYIGNYSYYDIGGQNRIDIAISGGKQLKNADTYTVTITLSDSENFAWSEKGIESYTFTFIIQQFVLEINWTVLEVTYSPSIPGAGYTLNKFSGDDVELVLVYMQNGSAVSLTKAGRYTVTVDALSGDESDNYTLAGTSSETEQLFTVKKQGVDKPTLPGGSDDAFNGTSGSKSITFADYYDSADVQIEISGVVPGDWFTGENARVLALPAIPALSFAEGGDIFFTYTRAGVYTFIVSLNAENYYWADEEKATDFGGEARYEYELTEAFTVERKQLPAPSIKEQRAQEFRGTESIDFGSNVGGVEYGVLFGDAVNGGDLVAGWLGWADESHSEGKRGVYFAELTLKTTATVNPLNYQWGPNENDPNSDGDTDSSVYLKGYRDVIYYEYSEGNGAVVRIRIYYTITSSQLKLTLNVKDYTFGDNGTAGKAFFDPNGEIDLTGDATVYLTGDDLETLERDTQNRATLTGLSFERVGGGEVVIVNGLPWNQGTYILRGKLTFGDGTVYQEMPGIMVEFTVSAKPIEIAWDEDTLSYTYDNTAHEATATVTTEVYAETNGINYAAGLTLTVIWEGHAEEPMRNAGKYTVIVSFINGNEDGNFVLPALELRSNTLVIAPKAVTIKGQPVTRHVFGDEINEETELKYQDLDDLLYADKAAEYLKVEIYRANKTEKYEPFDPVGGTYYVIVRWEDDQASYATNYDVTFDDTATFEVVRRELTVEWLAARGAYGVPGEDYELYEFLNVTKTNGNGDAFAGMNKEDVIILTPAYSLKSVPDAAVYAIVPTAKDADNWDITFTNGDSWTYEIYKATINATFKTYDGLVYAAADQTIVESTYDNILDGNNAKYLYGFVKEGEDASAVTEWLDMTPEHGVAVFDAGTYYVFVKITAKNYEDFVTESAFKVEVAQAELKVRFDFIIMYGEENPATHDGGYLFGTENVRKEAADGRGWTVIGLLGGDYNKFYYAASDNDRAFYGLTGDATYRVELFPTETWGDFQTAYASSYTIIYNGTLSCGNYYFTAEEGSLQINKINLTVTGETLNIPYNENPLRAYDTEGVGYTVEHPDSTYGGNGKHMPENNDYTALIEVSSQAFTGRDNPTTADVKEGGYELTISGGAGQFYTIERCVNGTVNIMAAKLTVYTIEGYNSAYDEQWHGLSVNGDSTVESALESNGASKNLAFAKASDNTTVTVEFYEDISYAGRTINDSVWNRLDKSGIMTKAPAYIDVGTFGIIYRISAGGNYQAEYGYCEIKITQGKNELKTEFQFADAPVAFGPDARLADAPIAWIYGYGVDGGFDAAGKHAITNPEAIFARASATATKVSLKYRLWHFTDGEGNNANQISVGDYKDVSALFAIIWEEGFQVGYYHLEVYMDTAANFTFATVNYYFRVARRELTVSAADIQISYGQENPTQFTTVTDGLVPNRPNAAAETVGQAIDGEIKFATNYTQGDDAGTYTISVSNANELSSVNYELNDVTAVLEVRKRAVTITIISITVTYNDSVDILDLTFEVAQDSEFEIYKDQLTAGTSSAKGTEYNNGNQTLLTLCTDGIVKVENGYETNHVKWSDENHTSVVPYTIYAVFNDEDAHNSNNYDITFIGCAASETDQEAIGADKGENAGEYKIERARVSITNEGVFHLENGVEKETVCYTGEENYLKAYLSNLTPLDITYEKRIGTTNTYEPVETVIDAGTYRANCSSTNWDYDLFDIYLSFTIAKAKLTLTANEGAEVEYGTPLSGNAVTDATAGGAVATGRFTGFSYTVESTGYAYMNADVFAIFENNSEDGTLVTYSVVGYTPQTSIQGQSATIRPVCVKTDANSEYWNDNIEFELVEKTLTIIARKVKITIIGWGENDAAWSYYLGSYAALNEALNAALNNSLNGRSSAFISTDADPFGASTDDYAALNIKLELEGGALNVGTYDIVTYGWNNPNYAVTFVNETQEGTLAQFNVQKAKLTLYAYDTRVGAKYADMEYGTTINCEVASGGYSTSSGLQYTVEGVITSVDNFLLLLGSQKIVFTVTSANKVAYEAWTSGVGTYTVDITRLPEELFTNYTVENYVTATLTIKQRTIEAYTADQIFEFIKGEYHGGAYGKSHEAEIEFTDPNRTKNDAVNIGDFRPGFTLSYTTSNGAAPTFVGQYQVTVTLNTGSNYRFENGNATTLNFNITPMSVSDVDLNWETSPISLEEYSGEYINQIENYQNEYLKLVSFTFEPASGSPMNILPGSEEEAGTYYFKNGVLYIKLNMVQSSVGNYTVRIELEDAAKQNIELKSGSRTVDFFLVTFAVTTDIVTMEVMFQDFYYRDQPGMPTVWVNSVQNDNVSLRYAAITDRDTSKIQALYDDSRSNMGLTGTQIVGLERDSFTISPTFTVGYYLLSVYDAPTSQTRYFVFMVMKKKIGTPTISAEGMSYNEETGKFEGLTYNGDNQNVQASSYDALYMTPDFGGGMIDSGDVVTFVVFGAGYYEIRFVLRDGNNTEWDGETLNGAKLEGTTLVYSVYVAKDERNNDADVLRVPEHIDNMVYGDYYDMGAIWTKSGYSGSMTLYYAPKTDDVQSVSQWTQFEPYTDAIGAGSYWLKAVVSDPTTENYADKTGYGAFTIAKKQIFASVSGTIAYGDLLADTLRQEETAFKPVYSGILAGDSSQVRATFGAYSYVYVGADDATLTAGGVYYIILQTDESGNVVGIDGGDNYIVKATEGRLYVNKRNVTVSIQNQEGFYAVDPALYLSKEAMKDQYTVDRLAEWDKEHKEVLDISFQTNATYASGVGSYLITITYDDTNYNVSYQPALYTVKPLTVKVQVVAQENIFYDGERHVGATFDPNNIVIPAEANAQFVKDGLNLTLHYTGTSYKSGYYDSVLAPSEAGVYTAQVEGAGSNIVLDGLPSVEFTIQKQNVDDGLLSIANQTYTGEALTPVIQVEDSAIAELFNTGSGLPSFTGAGTYDVVVYLNDADNYKWVSTTDGYVSVKFTIDKAQDAIIGELSISNWQYGRYSAEDNSPFAQVKSGRNVSYEYSTDGVNFSNIVPDTGSVGVYYVRIVVAESENYNAYVSEPVAFEITKYYLAVPKIIESDDTFTGNELTALISNYDARYMAVMDESEARTFVGAANITAVAVNAGVYKIYVVLNDIGNYGWLENAGNAQGVLTLTWTVGKMKVALPTAGKNSFVVNGQEIVYTPNGFDESIMAIENNKSSYGGKFVAVITLKDTANYEWADGSSSVELKWSITGSDVVFAIIMSVLALCTAAGATGIATQLLLDKRRKRTEAEAMSDIENKDIAHADEGTADAGPAKAEDAQGETSEENPTGRGGEKA